jgi:hypothetical protein
MWPTGADNLSLSLSLYEFFGCHLDINLIRSSTDVRHDVHLAKDVGVLKELFFACSKIPSLGLVLCCARTHVHHYPNTRYYHTIVVHRAYTKYRITQLACQASVLRV